MPRRAAAQIRPLEPDPVHRSRLVQQVINKVMLDGKKSTAERIVYDALAILAEKTGKDPVEALEAVDQDPDARAGGPLAPRRRRHLPGAGRGSRASRAHAGRPLAGRVLPQPPREGDARRGSPESCSTRSRSRAGPTSARTTSSAWRRRTRRSRTTAGRRINGLGAPARAPEARQPSAMIACGAESDRARLRAARPAQDHEDGDHDQITRRRGSSRTLRGPDRGLFSAP